MKLLSTPQGKSKRELENVDQELRSIELDGIIRNKRKELEDLEKRSLSAMSATATQHYEEESLWKNKIKTLTEEVVQLEARRERALLPTKEKEKEVRELEKSLFIKEEHIKAKESDLLRQEEITQDRLLEIQKRELGVDEKKRALEAKRSQIELDEKTSITRLIDIEQSYEDLLRKEADTRETLDKLDAETTILRAERGMLLVPIKEHEKHLSSKEKELSVKQDSLIKREGDIEKERGILEKRIEAISLQEDQLTAREMYIQKQESNILHREGELAEKIRQEESKIGTAYLLLKKGQDANDLREREIETKLSEYNHTVETVLVPLENREKELDTKTSALLRREELVAIKESDLSQTEQLLLDKLDSVSEREQQSLETQQNIESRVSNITLQEQELSKRQEAVTEIMKQAIIEKEKDKKELAKQKALITGRQTVLSHREKEVEKKEKGFADREKAINDKYKTLQRAIAEMKLKYGDKLTINL